MRINYDAKLNFEDVLLQPKRSTLSSRKDVDMTRNFTFRNSGKQMNFLPIFASNMDGVGTFSMAKEMQKHKMMTVITKTTGIEEWRKAIGNGVLPKSNSYSATTVILHRRIDCRWKRIFLSIQLGLLREALIVFTVSIPTAAMCRN